MKKFFRILNNNFRSAISIKKLIFIVFIFLIITIPKVCYFNDLTAATDYIKIIFYGPKDLTSNINALLNWSLYEFFLLFIIGDFIYYELKTRNIYTISKIGSKFTWIIYMQLTIFLLITIYHLIGLLIIFISIHTFNFNFNINDFFNITHIVILLILVSYLMSTIYFFILFLTKNHSLSFIITILVFYLSISIGNMFNLDRYLPLNRGILNNHYFFNLSFNVSNIYILTTIIINLYIIIRCFIKNDLFNSIN